MALLLENTHSEGANGIIKMYIVAVVLQCIVN